MRACVLCHMVFFWGGTGHIPLFQGLDPDVGWTTKVGVFSNPRAYRSIWHFTRHLNKLNTQCSRISENSLCRYADVSAKTVNSVTIM